MRKNVTLYGTTQFSKMVVATYEIDVFEVGIVVVSFEIQSVILKTGWFPFFVKGRKPRLSTAIISNGPAGEKRIE